jgi:hypothetical protein
MEANTDCAEHAWRSFTEDEMKDLRSKSRAGRPPMAWVEEAEQCERCGRIEARVSWYGQAHRVPYAPKEAGQEPVIQWPTRQTAPGGGGGGMGMT